jgi:glycine/sarcosine N-methyltransferase
MADTPKAAFTADYDQFVDWDARLAREGPFFRGLFEEIGARRIADVGCGSGRHALMFASWGLDVVGIDPSESMLASARANAVAAGVDVPFLEGGFGDVAGLLPDPVDAVICTGNALPHVGGVEGLRAALADFAAVLRPDGAVVLHLLNHDRLLDKRPRAIPPVVRDTPEGERVFLRVLDYDTPGGIGFDFLTLTRGAGGAWALESRRSVHTALPTAVLSEGLTRAGFARIEMLGGHDRKRFDAATDESVIVLARRA